MKKILFVLLAVAFIWCSPVYAESITVVTEEYPPYNYIENGKITGCSTEIVHEVMKRSGIDYTIKSYPWARTYNLAQNSPNTLIYSIGRNEKREKLFQWVGVVAPYEIFLFKAKARKDIEISSLEDAQKYKIGAVRDDVRAQYLEKNGINNADLVPNDTQNIKKLLAGRIDLMPVDKLAASYLMKKEGLNFGDIEQVFLLEDLSTGLYLAFSLQTDEKIVEKCRKALAEIKDDGTYDSIMKKYL